MFNFLLERIGLEVWKHLDRKNNLNLESSIKTLKSLELYLYNYMEFYKIKSNLKLLIYKIKSSISPKSKQTQIRE